MHLCTPFLQHTPIKISALTAHGIAPRRHGNLIWFILSDSVIFFSKYHDIVRPMKIDDFYGNRKGNKHFIFL